MFKIKQKSERNKVNFLLEKNREDGYIGIIANNQS
jgi:hypothetical protein